MTTPLLSDGRSLKLEDVERVARSVSAPVAFVPDAVARIALKLREAVRLLETVLALELLCGAQGLEFLAPLRPGRGVADEYRRIREAVRSLERDREPGPDIRALESMVLEGVFSRVAREHSVS